MFREPNSTIGGKISIFTALLGVGVLVIGLIVDLPKGHVAHAQLSATTSVTVLNTPPYWVTPQGEAQEQFESSTNTPTNATGTLVRWVATADDTSNDSYFLLICKASTSPIALNNAPPDCGGGTPGNHGATTTWAKSGTTTNNTQATVSTTTTEGVGSQFLTEFNDWYGYICDANITGPQCHAAMKNGNGTTSSPFVVNHRPIFTSIINDGPKDPGAVFTWTATATDTDEYSTQFATDTIRLFICKAADFTGYGCGPGGVWATSTFSGNGTIATSSTLASPLPDGSYNAFAYIVDQHGTTTASGGSQGAASPIVVSNTTPTIAGASVSVLDTDDGPSGIPTPLTLTGLATQTPGFSVRYTVADTNSCKTITNSDEIIFGLVNVYRSGVTQAGCDQSSMTDPNRCYAFGSATTSFNWKVSCTASTTSCVNNTDSDMIWDCTFPLWYFSQATDGDGSSPTHPPHFAENWRASAQAADDDYATSSLVESTTGTELTSFLGYDISTSTIAYGGLQPGQSIDPIGPTTQMQVALLAEGNVGLNETLYGVDMCPGYPAACSGNATSTIFVPEQKYAATSSTSYAAAIALAANPGATLGLEVQKSTSSTSTPSAKITYWGIRVPIAITLAGDYLGQNTIIGVTSPRGNW